MSNGARYVLLACMAAVPACASAQWIPVTANKVETTTVTNTSTQAVSASVKNSKFYRDAAGSQLTLTDVSSPDDASKHQVAVLLDNRRLSLYKLNYAAKTAVEQGRNMSPRMPVAPDQREKNAIGHEVIEGLDCAIVPVYANNNDGKLTTIGRNWVFLPADLTVKSDVVLRQPGFDTRIAWQLTNITLNATSDPDLFQVPGDFRLKESPAGVP